MATYPVPTSSAASKHTDGPFRTSAPFGWRYASKEVLSAESFVELPAAPGARVRVSDLLP
jgi:hypothetical protein